MTWALTLLRPTSGGQAVASIEKSLGDKLAGYVVDLRANPGGLLDEGIAVTDEFLREGVILSTRGTVAVP